MVAGSAEQPISESPTTARLFTGVLLACRFVFELGGHFGGELGLFDLHLLDIARLALLAAVQGGGAAHDCLVRFWLRALAPIPPGDVEGWIYWNVPEPPGDPSVDEIVAYAELVAMVSDPELNRLRRALTVGPRRIEPLGPALTCVG
ncbi:hypothetical protein [Nocardia sp. GTS18]|uniref:hypothetical protein n=1 Tax=Nocardia sp. GTS18 TaxID=1778064 RepID=UPI0015EF0B05|nr:hypothetical protein [Nocardia sp. GTS18]